MADQLLIEILKGIYHLLYEAYYSMFIRSKIAVLLKKHHRYYNLLTTSRKKFERVTWDFIRYNKFIPRGEVKVTLARKVIIAAHAMQLAYRLPDECYDYYEKIILYKDYYRSRLTQKLHKAEVNPAMRIIVFSERAILESISDDDDGLNVLLHEFAHALWLEHLLQGHAYRIFDDHAFNNVRAYIGETLREESGTDGFFRQYAYANEAEFFAVIIENFFERAEEFKKRLPELYQMVASLLKQDPLKVS